MQRIAAILLATMLAGNSALAQAVAKTERGTVLIPSLSVSGHGESFAAPDRAVVRLGAVAQREQASEAQEQVNKTVAAAIEQIKNVDIPDEAIKTEGVTLSPVYAGRSRDQDEPRIVGYRAGNTISVSVEDLILVGAVIDAGVKKGANHVEGLSFELKDEAPQKQAALRQAIHEAGGKAKAMAGAMGVNLQQVLEVSESGAQPPRPMMLGRAMIADGAATPVQPGQLRVEASVTITYQIGEPIKAGP